MRIPLWSHAQELAPAPRRFLAFTLFNVLSWQCLVGPAMVLFARHVGMPASWVGALLSFMPIAQLVVVFTIPLVLRLGSKRIMLITWAARNAVACIIFLTPLALWYGGEQASWAVIIVALLGFCLLRAIGSGGWFPWLHEVVPPEQRGIFFSVEMMLAQLMSVVAILLQALVLGDAPGMPHYLALYAIGIVAGWTSLLLMARVPGGAGSDQRMSMRASFGAYRFALRNRPFMGFIVVCIVCFSALAWLGASLVLFMRDGLGMESRPIMLLMALGSAGVMLTVRHWARFAEHSGSGRAMFKVLVAHSAASLLALFLGPNAWWSPYLLPIVVVVASVYQAAFFMIGNRAMLNYVQEEGRVGYTNVWTVCMAASLGLTPIAAGWIIDAYALGGFRLCFAFSAGGAWAGAVLAVLLVQEGPRPEPLAYLMNPGLPVRTLTRIVWITLGMHESNRPPDGTA